MRRDYAIGWGLGLVTLLVYWPLNGFEFVNFDDPVYVAQNHAVLPGVTWHGLSWALTTSWTGNWHPVTWISHMFDCQLYGLNPRGHHLTNLFFHVANTFLLFSLLRRMTGAVWRSALVAGLFAWHPMHIESVAWVAERKDVLSTFFGLLAMAAYVRYASRESPSGTPESMPEGAGRESQVKHQVFYVFSVLCFALSLMSKPMLVTLPFVLLLLDWWPLQRFSGSNFQSNAHGFGNWRQLVREKIPFLAMALASSIVTYVVQQKAGNVAPLSLVPLSARLGNVPVAYCTYVAKLFWPAGLCALYPFLRPWPVELSVGAALFLVLGLLAIVFWGRGRAYFIVGTMWFFGMLVPVIGFVHIGGQAMADRYSYLSSVGLFIAVAWGLGELAARLPYGRPVCVLIASASLVGCIGVTHRLLPSWKDSIALFERALEVNSENPIALCNLANALMATGKYDESISRLQQALVIKPDLAPAQAGMGWCLLQQGKPAEAVGYYRAALQFDSRLPDACGNLAWILATSPANKDRNGAEAVQLATRACALTDYQNPLFLTYLAAAYAEAGRFDDAIATDVKSRDMALAAGDHTFAGNVQRYLELHRAHQAFRSGADPAVAACEDARRLAADGRIEDAVSRYREALRLDPTNVTALNNLAWILSADSDPRNRVGAEAVELAERACELTSYRQPVVIGTLAAAYAEAGQYAKAVEAGENARAQFEKLGRQDLAETNKALVELYRSHKAFPGNKSR